MAGARAQELSDDYGTFVAQLPLLTDDDIGRLVSALEFSANRDIHSRGFEWLCPRILARKDFLKVLQHVYRSNYKQALLEAGRPFLKRKAK